MYVLKWLFRATSLGWNIVVQLFLVLVYESVGNVCAMNLIDVNCVVGKENGRCRFRLNLHARFSSDSVIT